ncbi:hypothetical protein BEWA_030530 [Theileria equi strain WA]|uniref:Uncharacterized protein n=1 Tax=Theileria equi strain WA TaxID=1537102 RepID=L0AZ70_THEEQ|nr:hypothetical protein BEWA_030530 [Theileria equi strain WA]AFZ80199.1 hypothetical protein BEWA_030530 [Theileria equi strain WA]|eukprot:XP_004829865.1 hypothetical protein BEWA_030530 [Theileria equi strain WA]
MGARHSLLDTKFNLKLQAREAEKYHAKCLREAEVEKLKVKSALEKSNAEAARIHAANSIRKHNEALKFLQYKAKIDMILAQVETAIRSQNVTVELKKALPHLNKILNCKSMDSVDIFRSFEKVFEDLEVRESYSNQTMAQETAHLAPAEDVDVLISRVAEEHALDVGDLLHATGVLITPTANRTADTTK